MNEAAPRRWTTRYGTWQAVLALLAVAIVSWDFRAFLFGPMMLAVQDVWSMDYALKHLFFTDWAAGAPSLIDPLNLLGGSVASINKISATKARGRSKRSGMRYG
jgi:hypothetical protein